MVTKQTEDTAQMTSSVPSNDFWYDYMKNKHGSFTMSGVIGEFPRLTIVNILTPIVAIFLGFLVIQASTFAQLLSTHPQTGDYFINVATSTAAAGILPMLAYRAAKYTKVSAQTGSDPTDGSFVHAISIVQEMVRSMATAVFVLIGAITQFVLPVVLYYQYGGLEFPPLSVLIGPPFLFFIPMVGILFLFHTLGDLQNRDHVEENWSVVLRAAEDKSKESTE
jgi:hypothetical protein